MGVFSSGNQPAKAKKKSVLLVQGRSRVQGRTSKSERHFLEVTKHASKSERHFLEVTKHALQVLHGKAIHHDGIKEYDMEKYELARKEMQVAVNEENVEVQQKLTMAEKETCLLYTSPSPRDS